MSTCQNAGAMKRDLNHLTDWDLWAYYRNPTGPAVAVHPGMDRCLLPPLLGRSHRLAERRRAIEEFDTRGYLTEELALIGSTQFILVVGAHLEANEARG